MLKCPWARWLTSVCSSGAGQEIGVRWGSVISTPLPQMLHYTCRVFLSRCGLHWEPGREHLQGSLTKHPTNRCSYYRNRWYSVIISAVLKPNSESCVCTLYQNIDIHLSMHQPNMDINNLSVCVSRNQNIAWNNTDLCQFQVFEAAQHPQQLQAQGCLRDVQKARPVENMMFAAHLVEHMESRL